MDKSRVNIITSYFKGFAMNSRNSLIEAGLDWDEAINVLKDTVEIVRGKGLFEVARDEKAIVETECVSVLKSDARKVMEDRVKELMENCPEYSMSLQCTDWDYENCVFEFYDEEDDKATYVLDLDKLVDGYKVFVNLIRQKKLFVGIDIKDINNFDAGNWDVEAVDALIQCAIFGEVIYG